MSKKRVISNIFSSTLSSAFLMLLNIFVSQILLLRFGSEVNGLISSVNQIFSYVAILEAGIGTATVTALYKPISQKNREDISAVLAASNLSYRKSAIWYFLCVTAMSVVWPLAVDTNIGFFTIFSFIFLQGISNVITYCFTSSINNYLLASGKNYINNYLHICVTVLTYCAKIVIAYKGKNIAFISFASLGVNLLKCIFYAIYAKKNCAEISFKSEKTVVLKEKTPFFLHEISGVVFSSTDMILISVFCSLSSTSVYAVYSMPFNAISTVCLQGVNSLSYILGQAYARTGYEKVHDSFSLLYVFLVFVLFTCAYLLVIPFVSLYTSGVTDINYVDYNLPILFTAIQLLSSMRIVDNNLIKIAGYAKKTISRTLAETGINLAVSLVLVKLIGIYGVLTGTIVALLYRTTDIILYANHKILKRSALRELKLFVPNLLVFCGFIFLNNKFPISISTVLDFITSGLTVLMAVFIAYLMCNLLFNYAEIKLILKGVFNEYQG